MLCCQDQTPEPSPSAVRVWTRRGGAAARWAIPIAGLALIPKCPGCVAAYVLMLTGVGLSFGSAEMVRWALIGLCVLAIAWASVRMVRRWMLETGAASEKKGSRHEASKEAEGQRGIGPNASSFV
ncbi:MAG: hypothetical protein J0L78_06845 [Planctomycetes bacterium]|nr:hypothetical protein [Planctomycetota bacterium]